MEVLVQLDRALCNGLFGLAHEALVADCRCLAVCCSDMQDYTMCSHRERRESKRRERRRAEKENERKGRWEVKGLKRAKEKRCPPRGISKYARKRQEFYRIAFQNDNYENAIRSREGGGG